MHATLLHCHCFWFFPPERALLRLHREEEEGEHRALARFRWHCPPTGASEAPYWTISPGYEAFCDITIQQILFFLSRIQRAMATSNAPWRCAWCMRLKQVESKSLWSMRCFMAQMYRSYVRPWRDMRERGPTQTGQKDWEDEEYWNRGGNASRHVSSSRSASARADKHAKHAKGKTNKNRSKANKKTSAPPLEPPWNAGHDVHAPSVPSASREEVQKAEDKYNQLVSKLQNAKDEEEMRQIVAESNRGTASSKSMHQAVYQTRPGKRQIQRGKEGKTELAQQLECLSERVHQEMAEVLQRNLPRRTRCWSPK